MSAQFGLIGLGTMGQALALNIAEKGFPIAVFNRTGSVTTEFAAQAGDLAPQITPTQTLAELVAAITPPRAIILMVPAGQPVDDQIAALTPLLDADDLIIDAGNANFHDTNRRMAMDQPFLGVGVSGGEEGARHGPAIMGGGPRDLWDRVAPMMDAISAKFEGAPCSAWMGPQGAGHFVKAVHNGIEYADMQLIAEIYGILRDGLGWGAAQVGTLFDRWNQGPLQSYLVEITGKVAGTVDHTGVPLLDVITDAAGQKGTGRWTVIEAQHLGAPVPTIEAAVVARNMSSRIDERAGFETVFGAAPVAIDPGLVPEKRLENALICGKILCYAQGFQMIGAASEQFNWDLNGPTIARTWREGCIIRSAMLDQMAAALAEDPAASLMSAPYFAQILKDTHHDLRSVVATAVQHGIAVPALSAALSYFDTMRTGRGTANMIQGQRDFFGLHGFERLDDGTKDNHGPWHDPWADQ